MTTYDKDIVRRAMARTSCTCQQSEENSDGKDQTWTESPAYSALRTSDRAPAGPTTQAMWCPDQQAVRVRQQHSDLRTTWRPAKWG